MSTFITKPNIGKGNSGATSGAVGGAAQGAVVGATVGGPVGAVIGGAIGGIVGAIGGGQMDKADKHKRIAFQYQKQGVARRAAMDVRQMLRDFRKARAMSLMGIAAEEGGTQSSAPLGALAGLGSQYSTNDAFYHADYEINRQVTRHNAKAGRAAANAGQTFGLLQAGLQLGSVAYGAFQNYKATQASMPKPISSSQASEAFSQIPKWTPPGG